MESTFQPAVSEAQGASTFQPHAGPQRSAFSGTHFASAPISGNVLRGGFRGSSPDSTDAHRVNLPPNGAPPAVHAYRTTHIPHPRIKARPHAYGISGNKAIANLDQSPARDIWGQALVTTYQQSIASGLDRETAKNLGMNAGEHALLAAGYDGMESPNSQPGAVILWGDQEIDKSS